MSAALQDLKNTLQSRFPDALPLGRGTVATVSTGAAALDTLLPGGGLARGRLTAWRPGGGATAVLRAACETAVRRGERAAWIDAGGMQSADFWRRGPVLVRPASQVEALVAAEELLRSGGFALVVLLGASREVAREAVRLSRAARSGGAAFVASASDVPVAQLRVVSRIAPDGYRWRHDPFGEPVQILAVRLVVEATSLGWSGRTTLELPVRAHEHRLCPEPRLVDRRGAPAAARWGRRTSRRQSGHPPITG